MAQPVVLSQDRLLVRLRVSRRGQAYAPALAVREHEAAEARRPGGVIESGGGADGPMRPVGAASAAFAVETPAAPSSAVMARRAVSTSGAEGR